MSIHKHLEAIKAWHQQQGSPSADQFLPPLSPETIEKELQAFPYPVSSELKSLYAWHNGMQDNSPLFREFTFFPLEEALAEYELACEIAEEPESDSEDVLWKNTWLPIMGYMGDYLLLDCDSEAPRPGHIWFRGNDDTPYPWYDSLELMLLSIQTCFEQKAYFFDEDDILTEDWEAANQIRERLNPYSAKIQIERPEPIERKVEEQPDGSKKLTTWYSEDDYSEQYYGADNRKIGHCEYADGNLIRKDTWLYLGQNEVEITREDLLGILMVSKTRATILPDGSLHTTHVQTYLNDQLLYEQDLNADEDDEDGEDQE